MRQPVQVLISYFLFGCLAGLQGCKTIDVYQSADGKSTLPGVPFYMKQPVRVTDSAYALPASNVQIDIVVATKPPTTYSYPETPVNILGESKKVADIENRLGAEVNAPGKTLQEIKQAVEHAINDILDVNVNTKPESLASSAQLIANAYRIDSEIEPQQYYINSRNPLIGSASADFHLNGDYTLGEASASITDQTASTLIGLVPVAAYLSKQWNLDTSSTNTQTSSSTQIAVKAFSEKGHFDKSVEELLGVKLQPLTKTDEVPAIVVRFKVSPDRRVYVLREVEKLTASPAHLNVYTMQEAMTKVSRGELQLVRIATESQLSGLAKAEPKKEAPKPEVKKEKKSP
jgi:hypothetical protein